MSFNPHMHKLDPGDPSTIFFGDQFCLKNARFHVFLNFHARKHDIYFKGSGPNSQEMVNFVSIYSGSLEPHNWSYLRAAEGSMWDKKIILL